MLILIAGIGLSNLNAQSLVLKAVDGTENAKQLAILKKISFSNSNLLVDYKNGSTDTYSLSNVRKVYFKSATTATEIPILSENTAKLTVYPNPVRDVLYLQNAPEGNFTAYIYRMDVVLMTAIEVSAGSKSINVAHLSGGLYLLKINNQTCKFIKL